MVSCPVYLNLLLERALRRSLFRLEMTKGINRALRATVILSEASRNWFRWKAYEILDLLSERIQPGGFQVLDEILQKCVSCLDLSEGCFETTLSELSVGCNGRANPKITAK